MTAENPAVPQPAAESTQVTDHRGVAPQTDRVFFADPPADIGPLRTAESTLKQNKKPMSIPLRFIISILSALIVPGLIYVFLMDQRDAMNITLIVLACSAAVVIPIVFFSTAFRHRCTYVGDLGIARYTIKGSLQNQPKLELLRFQDAAEIHTAQTRNFYNGVYTGTTYNYNWTDTAGKRLFVLKGQYRSKEGTPKAGDPFHFARSAEFHWNRLLIQRIDAELAEKGYVEFNVSSGKTIHIGPGWIEFHWGKKIDRCEAFDIKTITLNQGAFAIKHKDARWFSSKGNFTFPYGSMANPQLFCFVLERFLPPSTWYKEPAAG